MKKIAIIPNEGKDVWYDITLLLIKQLHQYGCVVYLENIFLDAVGTQKDVIYKERARLLDEVDLLITLGGDGTLLRASKSAALHHVPVLGSISVILAICPSWKWRISSRIWGRSLRGSIPKTTE